MKWIRCARRTSRRSLLTLLTIGGLLASQAVGCASSKSARTGESQTATADAKAEKSDKQARRQPVRTHENLNAVVWVQTSGEYDALTRQAYNTARDQLERALETSDWTAAVEQTGDFADKPPAVVLDVDETVLDNSAYQAQLVQQGESYSPETWNAWCRKQKAPAVPGALAFTKYAARQGVTVFYLTNREHAVEEATRKNLRKLGFPLDEQRDVILTKHEREAWDGSKTPRREFIAEDFRITLLVGDNLGDFVADPEVGPVQRQARVDKHPKRWGRRWIVVPNPTYGHWEGAVLDYEWGADRSRKLKQKRESLTTPDEL